MDDVPPEPQKTPQTSAARLIMACTVGNALEFYDFLIFSFFASVIGRVFFPASDPTAQLLLAFATYGVGFFLRPLGGLLLGAYADRHGRRKATILTLMLMASGTLLIGLAPSYAAAGALGPAIVLLGRLIQGFSAGGEVGAATTLLTESAPADRRGFFGSWQLASQGLAIVAASIAAALAHRLVPADALEVWGWRVPFIVGVLIVPAGLWLRRSIGETHANIAQAETRDVNPTNLVVTGHWRNLLAGVVMVIGGAAANTVVVLYMSTYAMTHLGMPPTTALFAGLVSGVVTLIAAPVAGALSDRIGRKALPGAAYVALAVMIYPAFMALNAVPTLLTLLVVVALMSTVNAMGAAPALVLLTEIFPARVRATGMAVVYALGVTVFGGFGQFIVTWLIKVTGNPVAPAFYVIVCVTVALFALRAVPEMARKTLD